MINKCYRISKGKSNRTIQRNWQHRIHKTRKDKMTFTFNQHLRFYGLNLWFGYQQVICTALMWITITYFQPLSWQPRAIVSDRHQQDHLGGMKISSSLYHPSNIVLKGNYQQSIKMTIMQRAALKLNEKNHIVEFPLFFDTFLSKNGNNKIITPCIFLKGIFLRRV